MLRQVDNVSPAAGVGRFDVGAVRRDFPILSRRVNGRPLVYLDNAATTQKPSRVIDAVCDFYRLHNANIHRGVHTLSQEATAAFEAVRVHVADFLHAPEPAECLFVRGVTEAVNLVATAWGRTFLKPGDEVLVTALEHHSNIVPWQIACDATGAILRVFPTDETGVLDLGRLGEFVTPRTRFVSVQHVSNALGTVHDVKPVIDAAKAVGALVLIDGAQFVGHFPADVQALGCDFYAFSAHKLYGPTGVGVLWGRREVLETMPPFMGGGDMIETVAWERSTYAPIPNKFEAGTPDIAGVVGLGAAIDYLDALDRDAAAAHEHDLLDYARRRLLDVPGLRTFSAAGPNAGVVSFVLEDPPVSPLDVGTRLDAAGVAVRTGHHCAMPLMQTLGVGGTVRASLAFYNTTDEIDVLADTLSQIVADARPRRAGRHSTPGGDFRWPEPKAATPDEAARTLVDDFDFLKSAGEDPREFILDLGRNLPPMPLTDKNEATHVKGCMSQVWLTARRRPDAPDRIDFLADADADLVRGLIGVLQHVFSGQKAADILDFDVQALLRRLDLAALVSVQRRSGVEAMINRIRTLARSLPKEP